MRVAIETGVVGLAQLYETARTGIFRVISTLAEELLRREDEDISFTSLSSLEINRLTAHYFAARGLGHKGFAMGFAERTVDLLAGDRLEAKRDSLTVKALSRSCRTLRRYSVKSACDIFHSMYAPLPDFGKGAALVKILTIYDVIPLIHPEYFADGFAEEFRPITDSVNPDSDYVITISHCSKDDICSHLQMDPDRVFVTHPAAAATLYHPVNEEQRIIEVKKRLNIPGGRYFLTLATVERRKNLETAIRCFREFINQPGCDDFFFVLVGVRGWKVEKLVDEIASDPLLRERVIFTGYVADDDLAPLYSGAHGFLYLSLYEGFGLPPLEAMQCGLPVIASSTSSLPEVVGEAGILVDPFDIDDIVEAMLTLSENDDRRAEYVARGIERAAQFSWRGCTDQTVAVYRRVWEGR